MGQGGGGERFSYHTEKNNESYTRKQEATGIILKKTEKHTWKGSPTWEGNNLSFNMNNDWYLLKYIKYIKSMLVF